MYCLMLPVLMLLDISFALFLFLWTQEATNAHLIQVLALRKELEAKDAKIDTLQKRSAFVILLFP